MNNFNNLLTKTESLRTIQGGGESGKFRSWGEWSAGHLQALYYWDFFKKKLQNFTEKKEDAISSDHP